jgi:tetratricopeptide (TPR) repeat protein
MKKIVTLLFICPLILFGQDFKKEFTSKFRENEYNSTEIKNILKNWKKTSKNDVEYYISAFNFYFKESQQEVLQLTQDEPQEGKEALVLSDSLGNKSGYMYSQINTNDSLFKISQNTIDEAIKLFPNRLDLRFGKIHTLGEVKKIDEFTTEILKTIDYSKKINHKWFWSNDKILEDSENFFIDSMQSSQNTLFQIESDENLKKVAKKMYDIFPNDIFVISSYGVTFLIEEKNKEALELYLKAEKINPNDTIVLNNIGLIYERLSDKKNALKYYQKITEVGDKKAKALAEKKINQLK